MNEQGEGKGFLEPFKPKKSKAPVPGYLIALETSRYMVSYFDHPEEGIDADSRQYPDLSGDSHGAEVLFFDSAAEAITCYDVLSQDDLARGEISNLNIAVIVERSHFPPDPTGEGDAE